MRDNLEFGLILCCFVLFILWNYKYLISKSNYQFYKVTIVDNKAYWMYNNKLYASNVKNGKIDVRSKKKIDSMNMSEEDIHDLLSQIGN